jgi:hypothetical protein
MATWIFPTRHWIVIRSTGSELGGGDIPTVDIPSENDVLRFPTTGWIQLQGEIEVVLITKDRGRDGSRHSLFERTKTRD